MIKLGDAMNEHIDFNQAWQAAKFIIAHMIFKELIIVLAIAAMCSWHLANLLAKHNNRLREEIFSRRISYVCLALIVLLLVLHQFD